MPQHAATLRLNAGEPGQLPTFLQTQVFICRLLFNYPSLRFHHLSPQVIRSRRGGSVRSLRRRETTCWFYGGARWFRKRTVGGDLRAQRNQHFTQLFFPSFSNNFLPLQTFRAHRVERPPSLTSSAQTCGMLECSHRCVFVRLLNPPSRAPSSSLSARFAVRVCLSVGGTGSDLAAAAPRALLL